jgi:hypothetical protein
MPSCVKKIKNCLKCQAIHKKKYNICNACEKIGYCRVCLIPISPEYKSCKKHHFIQKAINNDLKFERQCKKLHEENILCDVPLYF